MDALRGSRAAALSRYVRRDVRSKSACGSGCILLVSIICMYVICNYPVLPIPTLSPDYYKHLQVVSIFNIPFLH